MCRRPKWVEKVVKGENLLPSTALSTQHSPQITAGLQCWAGTTSVPEAWVVLLGKSAKTLL